MNDDFDIDDMGLDPDSGDAVGTKSDPRSRQEIMDQAIANALSAGEEVPAEKGLNGSRPPADAGSAAIGLLFILVLAGFLGFELIRRVPSTLHTPLMSGANAISGITIVGALISAGSGQHTMTIVLGTAAVATATINVVGGYLVTDRMLAMFKKKGGN